jgi:hypothetical protein
MIRSTSHKNKILAVVVTGMDDKLTMSHFLCGTK